MKNAFAWVQVMRFSRLMVVSLALVGSMLAASPFTTEVDAAPDGTVAGIGSTVQELAIFCGDVGGALVVMFDFDESLNIVNAITTCHGGADDGQTCFITADAMNCMLIQTPEPIAPGLPDTADPGENPQQQTSAQDQNAVPTGGVAENPTWDGPLVVMTDDIDIDDAADGTGLLCEIFGGTSSEEHDWEIGDYLFGLAIFTDCKGGLLDGTVCAHGHAGSSCSRSAPPAEEVDSPPQGGNEMPADNAPVAPSPSAEPTLVVDSDLTPTPTATMAPTSEPTVVPTEVLAEPTVVPTMAPPPPQNDNSLPPGGGVEDPVIEPAPTELVLT